MWARIDETMAKQVRRVRPVAGADADPASRRVRAQIERDFGAVVPPFLLHTPAPALLAASWTMVRECLVTVHVERAAKEALAAAVSRANACTYCVDAHTAALHALGDAATADALGDPARAPTTEGALGPLLAWAAASRFADDPTLRSPPFTPAAAPELVGIACGFHYVNRMVTIFLAPSPMPFASPRLKRWTRRMLGPVLSGQLHRALARGESLDLLPDAPLPADLAWTAPQPTIAAAFARAAAAFDAAGAATLPEPVRALVAARVAAWRGEAMPLDRRWVDDAAAPLDRALHPAARLALLTAFAPERVDDAVVADFAARRPGDATLVAAAAWASFTAARRIAGWLAAGVS
jgi:AhpD family alkylhydroperoxidase